MSDDTVLETSISNNAPGHAAKHNAVNAQVNYLTEQWAGRATDPGLMAAYVRVFGVAEPTGVAATDTAAINTRIAAAVAAGGGEVRLGIGTYSLNALVSLGNKVTLRGAGMGRTILSQAHSGSLLLGADGVMPAKGSPLTTLTADAAVNANTLTLTSTTGLAAGDTLLLGSDATIGGSATSFIGEYVRVKSVDSGTQVTIHGAVCDSYTTAANAAVWKPTFLTNVGLADLTIVNPNPDTTTTQITRFRTCRNVRISNVEVIGADGPGIAVTHCLDAVIEGVSVRDSQDSDASSRYGYGVMVEGACEGVTVANSHFVRVRHGVTTTSFANQCGQPRRIAVVGCTATETTKAAFDTHAAGRDILFSGCVADGTGGEGFQIRSNATRVIGCTVTHSRGAAMYLAGVVGSPLVGVALLSNVIRVSSNHGIKATLVDGLVIAGNDINGTAFNGVDIAGNADRVCIERNRIFNAGRDGSAGQGIQFQNVSTGAGHIVTRNTIGNFASGEEPEITPGGTRYGVWLGTGTSGTYVADNIGVGLITGMISDTATGTVKSGNRQLDKNEATLFPNGVGTRVKAGIPADADFVSPADGIGVVDSTNNRIYFRVGGTWKYAALT